MQGYSQDELECEEKVLSARAACKSPALGQAEQCEHAAVLRVGSSAPTLAQLEEVLLAVNDLEGSHGRELADVPCVEPATLVQHLVSLLLILFRQPITEAVHPACQYALVCWACRLEGNLTNPLYAMLRICASQACMFSVCYSEA
jgi:hypothetical protein